jgi:hypothetical protein
MDTYAKQRISIRVGNVRYSESMFKPVGPNMATVTPLGPPGA